MSRLQEILNTITATGEESVDDLLPLLSPEKHEKSEIQQTFEEVIGYDPVDYYDKKGIREAVDDAAVRVDYPEDVRNEIVKNKETIADAAFIAFDNGKPDAFRHHVTNTLREEGILDPDEEDEDLVDDENVEEED